MAAEPRRPEPSALGEAADGFVELAQWFTGLVGDQVRTLTRAIDERELDVDTVVGAAARAATLPWLGLSAFVNELFDAATVLTEPLVRERTITSPAFTDPDPEAGQARALTVAEDEPFVNGFGEPLRTSGLRVDPAVLDAGKTEFRLVAEQVPPECVGVYRGKVQVTPVPEAAEPPGVERVVDVWLVVS